MSKNRTSGQNNPSSQPDERNQFEFPQLSVKDQVVGKNHAENVEHAIVRRAIQNILVRDQRTQNLFAKWDSSTGLMAAARHCNALLAESAQTLGFKSTQDFVDALLRREISDLDQSILISVLEDYYRRCDLPDPSPEDASRFVNEDLGIPWPWLASTLIQSFYMIVLAELHGGEAVIHIAVPDPTLPASLKLDFQVHPGESIVDAFCRVTKSLRQNSPESLQRPVSQTNKGYMPGDSRRQTLERYARWFYEYRLRNKNISQLSRTYAADRATIRRGIKEAERLLNLTPFSFE